MIKAVLQSFFAASIISSLLAFTLPYLEFISNIELREKITESTNKTRAFLLLFLNNI